MTAVCEGLEGTVRQLRGQRVGLVANHTAVTGDMRHLVDVLHESGVNLVALYGPEHGFYGEMDASVASGSDPRTGLPMHSLYGAHRKPPLEILAGVDALVFSIQDVGVRFYTYISTMANCMEAAAEGGLGFVVIDRPNPITGVWLEGNVSEPAFQSFVAVRPLPIRHGMTIGELAGMFNDAYGIGADLTVARVPAWDRRAWFDETGWPWVMPSPAMPTLDTAIVYPGICLLGGTNVSVGRGTTRPFELVGAPWIDAFALADAMNAMTLAGVFFRPAYVVPTTSRHKGERCAGVQLHVTDREAFVPVRTAMHLMHEIRWLHPAAFAFQDSQRIDRIFGTERTRTQIESGMPPGEILTGWDEERRAFEQLREDYLLYL